MNTWLKYLPRDDSFDPLFGRWWAIRCAWLALRSGAWRWGVGPTGTERLLQRFSASRQVAVPSGALFNEPLQLVLEYGWLGALAIATLLWQVLPHLRPGDPWSAAWVIAVVLSGTHFNLRLPMTGIPWLAITVKLCLS